MDAYYTGLSKGGAARRASAKPFLVVTGGRRAGSVFSRLILALIINRSHGCRHRIRS